MPDLRELCDIISSLKKDGKSGKIYFYGKEHGFSHSGIITVGAGKTCNINYLKKPPHIALSELRSLEFTTVMLVPHDQMEIDANSPELLDISTVLQQLEPGGQEEAVVSGKQTTIPGKFDISQAVNLKQEAWSLLEKFYGSGALKKVDEIAIYFSPHEKPREFLDKCKELAVLMVGSDKAEKLFKSLYARIS